MMPLIEELSGKIGMEFPKKMYDFIKYITSDEIQNNIEKWQDVSMGDYSLESFGNKFGFRFNFEEKNEDDKKFCIYSSEDGTPSWGLIIKNEEDKKEIKYYFTYGYRYEEVFDSFSSFIKYIIKEMDSYLEKMNQSEEVVLEIKKFRDELNNKYSK